MAFHQFFCCKWILHPNRHLKTKCYEAFKENRWSCFFFFRLSLSKAKIKLTNLDFHQFFCRKRLIHSKKYLKRVFLDWVSRKLFEPLLRSFFRSHFRFALLHFQFSQKSAKFYLCISYYIYTSTTVYKMRCFY